MSAPAPDFFKLNSAAVYAQRRAANPVPFWDRKLKQFNPFGLLTKEACTQGAVQLKNYANHNLFRPKGALSLALLYGGSGWLYGAVYKNRYHQKYEYH